MASRRETRHHHPEWWVVSAFLSVGLIVVAGLAAATGMY
ncbi:molybdopterin oxidoreductase [Cellulomonas edaphi]|uniref:Molybdopterin oxidoreductase n=1 Tax=Cellulomonas edaphi TaxID=3053468 RepID=A0ABT7S5H8_9CELL|nr:molybdopterin oxidoreductase [Cellulomons edaphi]MDM7830868.1 molybdopterin oxidoreductase [Cellulomons edaphi]